MFSLRENLEAAGASWSVSGLAWAQEKVFLQLCLFLSGCDKAKALGWTQSSAKLEFEHCIKERKVETASIRERAEHAYCITNCSNTKTQMAAGCAQAAL